MAQPHCPTRRELTQFNSGLLNEPEANTIGRHLDDCLDCQRVLETSANLQDTMALLIRRPALHDEYRLEQGFQRVTAALQAIGKEVSGESSTASKSEPADSEPLPRDLGQYQLIRKLGAGGMGTIYEAVHKNLKRRVAIKLLATRHLNNASAALRFRREMEAVGKLVHPNIVLAHDAGELDGIHYIVMELVEGIDLGQLLSQIGTLPVAEACEIIRQAAVGLQHAHEHDLVHRDIKPSNLMLQMAKGPGLRGEGQRQGQDSNPDLQRHSPLSSQPSACVIKILDLGLALLTQEAMPHESELTSAGQVMGTLDYMAPEQSGDSHEVDIRADIYSLGATFYKLLTGEAPFGGESYKTPLKKLKALANEAVPSIGTKRADLPRELVTIIDRMLAKAPEDRFAQPADVATALAPFAKEAGLRTLIAPGDRVVTESAKSLLQKTIADSAVSAAGDDAQPATVLLPSAINAHPRPSSADRARTPGWIVAVRLLFLGVAAGLIVLYRISTPTGTLIVEVDEEYRDQIEVSASRGGKEWTIGKADGFQLKLSEGEYALRLSKGDETLSLEDRTVVVKKGERAVATIIYVPNATAGKKAAPVRVFPAGESPFDQLRRENIDPYELNIAHDGDVAQAPLELVGIFGDSRLMHSDYIKDLAYSPDSKWIASASEDRTVKLWDAETGRLARLVTNYRNEAVSVTFNYDSSLLATAGDGEIRVFDPHTGKRNVILKPDSRWSRVAFTNDGQKLASSGKEVILWDLASGQPLFRKPFESVSVAISPDGQWLAADQGNKEPLVKVWKLPDGEEHASWKATVPGRDTLAFSPNSQELAAGGRYEIRIWNVATGEQRLSFTPQHRSARLAQSEIAFHPTNAWLAMGDDYLPAIRVLDSSSGGERFTLRGDFNSSYNRGTAIAFAPDGKSLASGSIDGAIRIWDLQTREERISRRGHESKLASVAITPDGTRVATVAGDKMLMLWNPLDGQPTKLQIAGIGTTEHGGQLDISPDGRFLACSHQLLELPSGRLVKELKCGSRGSQFSADSKRLVVCPADGQPVSFVDLETGAFKTVTEKFGGFSPAGLLMPEGRRSDVWNPFDEQPQAGALSEDVRKRISHAAWIDFHPDGVLAAVAGKNSEVLDLQTGKERFRFGASDWAAYSPDGQQLASAHETTLKILATNDGRQLRVFQLSAGTLIRKVQFAPDGRHVLTANGNGTVYVFRLSQEDKTKKAQ